MVAACVAAEWADRLVRCVRGARKVSFRGRLRLFFGLIVIVPMIALAVVLFTLTARSETGKADAGDLAAPGRPSGCTWSR